jgi:hypothetical protein
MQDASRDDIRRLLKTFGVKADETILAYLAAHADGGPLRLRVTLDDVTDYDGKPPAEKLHFTVEGDVRRSA